MGCPLLTKGFTVLPTPPPPGVASTQGGGLDQKPVSHFDKIKGATPNPWSFPESPQLRSAQLGMVSGYYQPVSICLLCIRRPTPPHRATGLPPNRPGDGEGGPRPRVAEEPGEGAGEGEGAVAVQGGDLVWPWRRRELQRGGLGGGVRLSAAANCPPCGPPASYRTPSRVLISQRGQPAPSFQKNWHFWVSGAFTPDFV